MSALTRRSAVTSMGPWDAKCEVDGRKKSGGRAGGVPAARSQNSFRTPLLAILVVGIAVLARLQARRPHHHRLAGLLPLLQIVANDAAVLDVQRTAHRPLA